MPRLAPGSRRRSLVSPAAAIAARRCVFLGLVTSTLCFLLYMTLVAQSDLVNYDIKPQHMNQIDWMDGNNAGSMVSGNASSAKQLRAEAVKLDPVLLPARLPARLNDSAPVLRRESVFPKNSHLFKIPHVIHQTWDDLRVPGQVERWVKSWQRLNPNLSYNFWTDRGARQLLEDHFVTRYVQLYDDYPHKINRADVRRLFILYYQGGVFADLDVECLQPLSSLLAEHHCILSQEPEEHQALFYDYKHPSYALTGFMACRPRHPFFKFLLQLLPEFASNARDLSWNDNILNSTGPMFLSIALDMYRQKNIDSPQDNVFVAPSGWFMPTYDPVHKDEFIMKCERPETPLSDKQVRVCDNLRRRNFRNYVDDTAYTNHHWLHSWAHAFIPRGHMRITDILSNVTVMDR